MSLLKDFQDWLIKIVITICLIALPIIFCYYFLLTLKSLFDDFSYYHSFTKAICNAEHYCIDIFVVCKNKEVIDIFPLGEGIQFSEDWKDPRPSSIIFKWC